MSEVVFADPDPDLVAGQVVGEYQIESRLGSGAFGTVFKASHPLIGKLAAIKVLARKYSVDPDVLERFIAEARAVNQIRHRHIIDIFSFGKLDDGRAYYVMEYLDGETLLHRLQREGRLPLVTAIPILRAIARALDAAHAKGIAHRDLKPENVFLAADPDGEPYPKLLDFGIAKLMTPDHIQKTRTGIAMGTPYYMSPEQSRGRDVDHRTDFYAFGVVAYQLLTGTYPIDDQDYMGILMKQISEEPPPPSSRAPGIPPGADATIAWLMRKDPAERPPNLATAVRALETAAVEAGLVAPGTFETGSAPRAGVAIGTAPPNLPAVPSGVPPTVVGNAPVTGPGAAMAAPVTGPAIAGPAPATALDAAPRKRSPIAIIVAVAAVVVVTVIVVVVAGGSGGTGGASGAGSSNASGANANGTSTASGSSAPTGSGSSSASTAGSGSATPGSASVASGSGSGSTGSGSGSASVSNTGSGRNAGSGVPPANTGSAAQTTRPPPPPPQQHDSHSTENPFHKGP